jgi:hypothetical protein
MREAAERATGEVIPALSLRKIGLLDFGCLIVRATIAVAGLASTIQFKYSGMIAVYMRKIPKKT